MNKNTQKKSRGFRILLTIILYIIAIFCSFLAFAFIIEGIEYENWIEIFTGCLFLLLSIFIFTKPISKKYRSSAKYQEKCYKRINRIHTYYRNGSITEEEYNELKQKILNQICD